MQPNEPSEKPAVRPFVNFPNGLIVTPWGDNVRGGVMISVVDVDARQGVAAYLGHDGLVRLFSWLIASGILEGEVSSEVRGDVLVQWPGPKPDAP